VLVASVLEVREEHVPGAFALDLAARDLMARMKSVLNDVVHSLQAISLRNEGVPVDHRAVSLSRTSLASNFQFACVVLWS
jgi:hypothetical protein